MTQCGSRALRRHAPERSRLTHSTDLSNTDPHFFCQRSVEREREAPTPEVEGNKGGEERRGEERERGEAAEPRVQQNREGQARPRNPQHAHAPQRGEREGKEREGKERERGHATPNTQPPTRTTQSIFRHSKKRTRGVHAVPRVLLASSLVVSFFQGPARYKKIVGGRVMMSKKKELQMARRRLGKEARDRVSRASQGEMRM